MEPFGSGKTPIRWPDQFGHVGSPIRLSEGAGSVWESGRVGKALAGQRTAVVAHMFGSQQEMHNVTLSKSENPMRRVVHMVVLKGTVPAVRLTRFAFESQIPSFLKGGRN